MSSYRRNGLPKPYLCSFNVMKYLWEFQCEFFFLLLGHCHLFHCNHTLHLTLASTLGCICKISQMVEMSLFPKSAIFFFSNSICVWFKFTSTLLFLFLHYTFLWSNSLLIIYFYKTSHGFITGRQESMWLHASLSVHELNNWCTVTNYQ